MLLGASGWVWCASPVIIKPLVNIWGVPSKVRGVSPSCWVHWLSLVNGMVRVAIKWASRHEVWAVPRAT